MILTYLKSYTHSCDMQIIISLYTLIMKRKRNYHRGSKPKHATQWRKQSTSSWPKKWGKKGWWVHRWGFEVQDKWFHEAKRQWYRARSAFKLIHIDEKFWIIKPGMKVLDVACMPGSWMQVLTNRVWPEWLVVGFDIKKTEPLPQQWAHTFVWDIYDIPWLQASLETYWCSQYNLLTSDIAPKTTGNKDVDQYESVKLNASIIELSKHFLSPGWTCILKVFVGEDIDELVWVVKKEFTTLKRFKPASCRQRSFEEYFICLGKK